MRQQSCRCSQPVIAYLGICCSNTHLNLLRSPSCPGPASVGSLVARATFASQQVAECAQTCSVALFSGGWLSSFTRHRPMVHLLRVQGRGLPRSWRPRPLGPTWLTAASTPCLGPPRSRPWAPSCTPWPVRGKGNTSQQIPMKGGWGLPCVSCMLLCTLVSPCCLACSPAVTLNSLEALQWCRLLRCRLLCPSPCLTVGTAY